MLSAYHFCGQSVDMASQDPSAICNLVDFSFSGRSCSLTELKGPPCQQGVSSHQSSAACVAGALATVMLAVTSLKTLHTALLLHSNLQLVFEMFLLHQQSHAMQVVFMKEMIAVLQQPPTWLKFPVKFGTYFSPLDKKRVPSTKLPRLLDQ